MIKGPGVFLAQFASAEAPFNSLEGCAQWAASLGYKGLQIPTSDSRFIDLARAAASRDYCDEIKGVCSEAGLEVTELSTHLQGQLAVSHPAYAEMFDAFAPERLRGDEAGKAEWAADQMMLAARASRNLGLTSHATFSGSLLWHTVYPWPQRPAGLVEEGFAELGRRWKPILDAFEENGVAVCYELHPGEDLHDGATFERFLDVVGQHPAANLLYDPSHFVLQQLDYLQFIDFYYPRIKAFHVKDAEFRPTGRAGVYGGYLDWKDRPGRFRSLGDGQVDFGAVFSKLTQYGYDGWAVLEWECCLKHPEQGASEGAPFISSHIIQVTDKVFDDFAAIDADSTKNRRILGLS